MPTRISLPESLVHPWRPDQVPEAPGTTYFRHLTIDYLSDNIICQYISVCIYQIKSPFRSFHKLHLFSFQRSRQSTLLPKKKKKTDGVLRCRGEPVSVTPAGQAPGRQSGYARSRGPLQAVRQGKPVAGGTFANEDLLWEYVCEN